MVRFKIRKKIKTRLTPDLIGRIARERREVRTLARFIFFELLDRKKRKSLQAVLLEHESRIMNRITSMCEQILQFLRNRPTYKKVINFDLQMALECPPSVYNPRMRTTRLVNYTRKFQMYELYVIISRVQDEHFKSAVAMIEHVCNRKEREWWSNSPWCAIFATLRIAWYFDPSEIKVLCNSDEDLAELQKQWQRDVDFNARALEIWPAFSATNSIKVLEQVYGLVHSIICKDSRFDNQAFCMKSKEFPLKEDSGLQELAQFQPFYESVGIGMLICKSKIDKIMHAIVFQTKGTKDSVFFEDTNGSNLEETFWEDTNEFSVLQVILVSKPPHEVPFPRA